MKKVMIFGAFDIIHPGHLSLLRNAKKRGNKLIVVVARDKTIKEVKGRKPKFNEEERMSKLASLNIADELILGDLRDRYKAVKEMKPDVVCLGYDQENFVPGLEKFKCNVVRLKAYKKEKYKSSKLG